MILYSYIFHAVYKGYRKSGDDHPGIYAVGIVSLMQFLTAIGVIMLPARLNGEKFGASNTKVFIIVLIVMLVNYIYFYKINTPSGISEKVEKLNPDKIKLLKVLTWIHIIITVGLFVFLINLPTPK